METPEDCVVGELAPERSAPPLVSIWARGNAPYHSRVLTLEQVNGLIRSDDWIKQETDRIRAVKDQGKEAYRAAKATAQGVIYAGHNPKTRGRDTKLVEDHKHWVHSGYILVECDPPAGSDAGPESIKSAAEGLPGLRQSATSMSGDGVHFVFEVSPPPESPKGHKCAWHVLAKDLNAAMLAAGAGAVKADTQAKDVVRLSFMSHDPLARFYPESRPVEWHSRRAEGMAYEAHLEQERKAARETEKAEDGVDCRKARKTPVNRPQAAGSGGYSEHDIDWSAAEYLGCQGGMGEDGYNCWIGMLKRLEALEFTVAQMATICGIRGRHPDCGREDIIAEKVAAGLPGVRDAETERNSLRGEACNAGWIQPGRRAGKGPRPAAAAAQCQEKPATIEEIISGGDASAEIFEALLKPEVRDHFAVLHGKACIARPSSGIFTPIGSGRSEAALGSAISLLKRMGIRAPAAGKITQALRLFAGVSDNPEAYGVRAPHGTEINKGRLVPVKNGGCLDLEVGRVLSVQETLSRFSFAATALEQVEFDPEIGGHPMDYPEEARQVLAHYTPELLDRICLRLLRTTKTIDTLIMPQPNFGKSTLADWFAAGLPGLFVVLDAGSNTSGQAMKFSSIERYLASCLAVVIDECDKLEDSLSNRVVNKFSSRKLRVELKGEDPYLADRRANLLMMGAASPRLEPGQGSAARFKWTHRDETYSELEPRLASWMLSPAGCRWLLSYIAARCAALNRSVFIEGNDPDDGVGAEEARKMLQETAPVEAHRLLDNFVAEPGAFTASETIAGVLRAELKPGEKLSDKAIAGHIRNTFPRARPDKNGRTRGWFGVKARDD